MLNEKTGAVLTVALLLLSAVGGVTTVTAIEVTEDSIVAASSGDETTLNKTVSHADEAYVTDDGSVILVYNYEESDDLEKTSGYASMNVSEGFAEFVMSQDTETDAMGNLTLVTTPDEMIADGALVTDRPAPLTNLRFELDSVQNRTIKESSMSLNSTVAVPQDTDAASVLALLREARTRGTVTTGATSLTADGSASVDLTYLPATDRTHEYLLTEQDGTYTLTVEESYVLGETGGWETAEQAQATLEEQYCEGADTTNVTCAVSLDSYDLTEEESGQRLDISYTVTIDGVDAVMSDAIVEGLTGPETNTTEAEAAELADRIENVSISRVEAEMVVEAGQMGGADVAWNVSLEGTDDLTLAYVELLEQIETAAATSPQAPGREVPSGMFGTSLTETAEQLREQTEARRAVGLETTSSWEFALTTGSETVTLNGTATSETTNWADYVSELDARDINVTDSIRTAIDVRTDGDRIVAEGSASVEDEGMFDRALTEYDRMANRTNVSEMLEAIRAADFEHARLDASVADGNTTVQGELSFGDGEALSDQFSEPFSMIEASETDLDAGRTAILLDAGLQSDADEDTVRALAFVGEETDISMPGDRDQKMQSLTALAAGDSETDEDEADDETESETKTETESETTETGSGAGPGFGIVPALLGATGGAAIAGRRLRDAE